MWCHRDTPSINAQRGPRHRDPDQERTNFASPPAISRISSGQRRIGPCTASRRSICWCPADSAGTQPPTLARGGRASAGSPRWRYVTYQPTAVFQYCRVGRCMVLQGREGEKVSGRVTATNISCMACFTVSEARVGSPCPARKAIACPTSCLCPVRPRQSRIRVAACVSPLALWMVPATLVPSRQGSSDRLRRAVHSRRRAGLRAARGGDGPRGRIPQASVLVRANLPRPRMTSGHRKRASSQPSAWPDTWRAHRRADAAGGRRRIPPRHTPQLYAAVREGLRRGSPIYGRLPDTTGTTSPRMWNAIDGNAPACPRDRPRYRDCDHPGAAAPQPRPAGPESDLPQMPDFNAA